MADPTTIRVAYDGEGLRDGSMDVRDLAPALLAIGGLIEEGSRELYGEELKLTVRVKSEFKRGSFAIDIHILQTIAGRIHDLFTGTTANALNNLVTVLGLSSVTPLPALLWFLKKMRGKKPSAVEQVAGDVHVTIDNSVTIINNETYRLSENTSVRANVEKMLAPLGREGIDEFKVYADEETTQVIKKEEREWFDAPQLPDATSPSLLVSRNEGQRLVLTVEAVDFRDGKRRWKVNDGRGTVPAEMVDDKFMTLVDDNKIQFGKGDKLVVLATTDQHMTPGGQLKSELTVTEVLEHRKEFRQVPFPHFPSPKEK